MPKKKDPVRNHSAPKIKTQGKKKPKLSLTGQAGKAARALKKREEMIRNL